MTEIVNFPNDKSKIVERACEWLARIDSGNLSEDEKTSLKEWLNQSDDHVSELKRLDELWDWIERSNIKNIPFDIIDAKPDYTPSKRVKHRRSASVIASVAASFFILVFAGSGWHYYETEQFKSTNGKYTTVIGGQQTILLADGSEIRLNTNTLLEVNYTACNRNVHLYSGEVYFNVAHDPDKPFIVKARKGDILALGTIFSVRVKNDRVSVIVEEGRVRIRANKASPRTEVCAVKAEQKIVESDKTIFIANAGNNVVFGEQQIESIVQEEKESLERKSSWKTGFLSFDDEPLSAVIEEVSRYTSNKIIIANPDIRSLRVGGYYPIGEIQVVFDALELNLGLRIEKVDERTYYISHAVIQK